MSEDIEAVKHHGSIATKIPHYPYTILKVKHIPRFPLNLYHFFRYLSYTPWSHNQIATVDYDGKILRVPIDIDDDNGWSSGIDYLICSTIYRKFHEKNKQKQKVITLLNNGKETEAKP